MASDDASAQTDTSVMEGLPSRFEQLWSVDQVADRLGNKIRYRPEEVRAWVDARVLASWLSPQDGSHCPSGHGG
jgi:hypothetical protein